MIVKVCHGTGDGSSSSIFNLGLASWYGIGFIDSCYRKCVIYFDVRGGHINNTGTLTCNNIVCNSTGNIITSGTYNLTQTQLNYLSTLTSSVATQSWVTSQGYLSSASYLPLAGGTLTGVIKFNSTMTLSTTYTGCRISLWYDGTNW